MKKIILMLAALFTVNSFDLFAEIKKDQSEKSLTIKAHVVKMLMDGKKLYRLELREFAAVYHAEEKFAPCLSKSIKEDKEVSLTISSQSLIVLECKI